jgi:hypothetical protein
MKAMSEIINAFEAPEAHQADPGGLLEELNTTAAVEEEPTTALEEKINKGDVLVDELSPEEISFLRQQIRRGIQQEQESQVAAKWCEKHRADYAATPRNAQTIYGILNEMHLPFTEQNIEKAFQAALASDALDMPTAESVSQAMSQDLIKQQAKVHRAAERQAEIDAERTQSVRTGIPNTGVEPPPAEDVEDPEQFREKIMSLPIDKARQLMQRKMHEVRTARGEFVPNSRYRQF